MIAPQVPAGKWWSEINRAGKGSDVPKEPGDQMRMTLDLVDAALEEYPIDPDRVYVTGLSMGGFGTWDAIQRRPKLFAAAVPVCGGGDAAQADKLTKIPCGSGTATATRWCQPAQPGHGRRGPQGGRQAHLHRAAQLRARVMALRLRQREAVGLDVRPGARSAGG